MNTHKTAKHPVSQKGIRSFSIRSLVVLFVCALVTLYLIPQTMSYGDNEAPTLTVDLGGYADTNNDDSNLQVLSASGESISVNADGGSTDAPDSSAQGCPPWTKTGNVQYMWHIQNVDGSVYTSVNDGDTTTEPSMTVNLDNNGDITVAASYQEEYQDSSSSPNTIYWPQ